MPTDELNRAIGRIEGKMDLVIEKQKQSDEQQNARFDAIDNRLDGFDTRIRTVEQRAVVSGAVAGGIMSVGIALAIEKLKTVIGVR